MFLRAFSFLLAPVVEVCINGFTTAFLSYFVIGVSSLGIRSRFDGIREVMEEECVSDLIF